MGISISNYPSYNFVEGVKTPNGTLPIIDIPIIYDSHMSLNLLNNTPYNLQKIFSTIIENNLNIGKQNR
jgi:hypothetical protein